MIGLVRMIEEKGEGREVVVAVKKSSNHREHKKLTMSSHLSKPINNQNLTSSRLSKNASNTVKPQKSKNQSKTQID